MKRLMMSLAAIVALVSGAAGADGDCTSDAFRADAQMRAAIVRNDAPRVNFVRNAMDRAGCPADSEACRERAYLIPLGAWGGFYPGESWLIALCFVVVGLFWARRARIPVRAKPLLALVVAIFFAGLLLATASNERVVPPFFAMHALWHVVGAFGFVALWALNHVRFAER